MAREPHVALFKTTSGSQKNLNRLSSKHCKLANTSKVTLESQHLCRLQLSCTPELLSLSRIRRFCGPMRHQVPLVWLSWKTIFKCEASMALSARKVPDPCYRPYLMWTSFSNKMTTSAS